MNKKDKYEILSCAERHLKEKKSLTKEEERILQIITKEKERIFKSIINNAFATRCCISFVTKYNYAVKSDHCRLSFDAKTNLFSIIFKNNIIDDKLKLKLTKDCLKEFQNNVQFAYECDEGLRAV